MSLSYQCLTDSQELTFAATVLGRHGRLSPTKISYLNLILHNGAKDVDWLQGQDVHPNQDDPIKVCLRLDTNVEKYNEDEIIEESPWSFINKTAPNENGLRYTVPAPEASRD